MVIAVQLDRNLLGAAQEVHFGKSPAEVEVDDGVQLESSSRFGQRLEEGKEEPFGRTAGTVVVRLGRGGRGSGPERLLLPTRAGQYAGPTGDEGLKCRCQRTGFGEICSIIGPSVGTDRQLAFLEQRFGT